MDIVTLIRKIPIHIQYKVGRWATQYKEYRLINDVAPLHEQAIKKLKGKEVLRCVFFATFDSSWQYDKVYEQLAKHPRFDPIILACPIVNNGRENMIRRMRDCVDCFTSKGYHVVKAYDEVSDRYVDVRKELCPDLIFYSSPYEGLVDKKYYITNYLDILGIYVPYFINSGPSPKFSNDALLHNLVWRKYAEYDYEKETAIKEQRVHGRNMVVTGYPEIEDLVNPDFEFSLKDWKIKDPSFKRIIWAPHHTIERTLYAQSCFIPMCDFMVELARKYRDKVQFVFKPHPVLYNNLVKLWGREKTDEYYAIWRNSPNTACQEGQYADLFHSSDAMIHDCGSFVFEYLFMNKPVLRTVYTVPLEEMYGKLGLACLRQHYKASAYSMEEVENFIKNVIDGVDPLKEQRAKFVKDVIMPKGQPSQNIVNDILDSIDNQIVYRS